MRRFAIASLATPAFGQDETVEAGASGVMIDADGNRVAGDRIACGVIEPV